MKFLFNLSLLINFSRTKMPLLANFLDILCTLPFSTKQICPYLPGTLPHHFLYTTLPVISLSQRQIPNQDDTEKWSLSLCSTHLNYFREQKLLYVFGWGLVEIINWVSSLLCNVKLCSVILQWSVMEQFWFCEWQRNRSKHGTDAVYFCS